jgi:hypothetical protein
MAKSAKRTRRTAAHGGSRRGAGRKVGSLNDKTRAKQIVEEEFRAYMLREKTALWRAQLERAAGSYVLLVKTKEGGYTRVTDPKQIEKIISTTGRGTTHWLIEAQPADANLAKEINNRLMGVPTQLHEVGTPDGAPMPVRIVHQQLRED